MIPASQQVHIYLAGRGFALAAPQGAAAAYEGTLNFRGMRVAVRLVIPDWDFVARPEVLLLERPKGLEGYRPHLGLGRSLCYVDRESVHMDRYQPAEVIGRCLASAEELIEEIAGDRRRLDLQGEFLANWRAGVFTPFMLWKGNPEDGASLLGALDVDLPHRKNLIVVTDDIGRTHKTLSAIQAHLKSEEDGCVCYLKTPLTPRFDPDHWPPRRLKDVLIWLENWAPALRNALLGKLESVWTRERELLIVVFSTPAGRFGFTMKVAYSNHSERRRLAKKRTDRRHRILGQNPVIERMVLHDLSPAHIHGRNQEAQETLAGRRIVLVGCGSVGGYLASFLARLGAGSSGGMLKLYDTQALMSENVGRHVLSMKDLYRNKAEATADLIKREFPYLDVLPRKVDATQAGDVFDAELVIDASGSTAISSMLNAKHVERLRAGAKEVLLYTWVEGRGEAARGLLVDGLKHMCFDCQFIRQVGQVIRDRFDLVKGDRHTGRSYPGDCASYMPFAVSAATTAAGLALDMARGWARGEPHPRLRSRPLASDGLSRRKDQSPEPVDSCPACRRT